MIVIDRVRIQGFRGIERLQMSLSRTSVLIGPNNSGKSSVLKALELALSDEISVNANDFHEPVKGRPGDRIVIDVRFIPVSDSDHRDARFSEDWQKQFVGLIRHDRYHREYMAFRTVFTLETDGIIKKSRYVINHWDAAKSGAELKELPESLQFVSIDADENILEDLINERSFVNRILNQMHRVLERHPEYRGQPITSLAQVLDGLAQTLEGPGTRLPDAAGLTADNIEAFFQLLKETALRGDSHELQGQGSRKSVAILSIVALADLLVMRSKYLGYPLFMMITAEEPEIHMQPNAQRVLVSELASLSHQLILTTHSPYVAAACEPQAIRSMDRTAKGIDVRWLPQNMEQAQIRAIKRLILRHRGEALFARGLIFVEGVTEEQLIRGMFQAYFGDDPSAFGVSLMGVDGKSYAPFMLMALSLRKPFCVISDNDGDSQHVVTKQFEEMKRKLHIGDQPIQSSVHFLSPGLAIEGELVYKTPLREEIIDSLMSCVDRVVVSEKSMRLRRERLNEATPRELKRRLEKKKAEYSGFLGEIISRNPYGRSLDKLLPHAVSHAFADMAGWIGFRRAPTQNEHI